MPFQPTGCHNAIAARAEFCEFTLHTPRKSPQHNNHAALARNKKPPPGSCHPAGALQEFWSIRGLRQVSRDASDHGGAEGLDQRGMLGIEPHRLVEDVRRVGLRVGSRFAQVFG